MPPPPPHKDSGASSSDQQQQQRHLLLQAAKAFCTSFAQKSKTPAEIVEAHFSSASPDEITAYEHGLPELGLPFVGRAFRGRNGVRTYFDTVGMCLSYADMRFPAAAATASHSTIVASSASSSSEKAPGNRGEDDDETEGWVVDVAARKVSVKGAAEFTWVGTGESWKEVFTYVLTFDGDQEAPKVRTYEVWADTGAAWLASRGELERVRKEEGGHRAKRDRMNTFGSVS